jgi:hypothetical protein
LANVNIVCFLVTGTRVQGYIVEEVLAILPAEIGSILVKPKQLLLSVYPLFWLP